LDKKFLAKRKLPDRLKFTGAIAPAPTATKPVLDLDADPDNHQNLIIFKLGPSPTLPENFNQLRM